MTRLFQAIVATSVLFRAVVAAATSALLQATFIDEMRQQSISTASSRLLAAVDDDGFHALNAILRDVQLSLPDTSITKSSVDISLTDLNCLNIYIHDIDLSHDNKIDREQLLDLSLSLKVDLSCTFYWSYSYDAPSFLPVVADDGQGEIIAENNGLSILVSFSSSDFASEGPTASAISECEPNINIVDMNFEGSVSAAIANVFEFAVRDLVEREIAGVLCEELVALGDIVSEKLIDFRRMLEPHLKEEYEGSNNALSAERMYESSKFQQKDQVELFDFMEENKSMVQFGIDAAITEINRYLSEIVPSSSGREELGINALVRSYFIDEDGYMAIPLNNMAPSFREEDLFVFDSVEVAFKSIRIKGLDTFTQIEPIKILGSQTLESTMTIDSLEVNVEIDIRMDTSNEDVDIISKNAGESEFDLTETLVIKTTVRKIDCAFSAFLGVDRNRFASLQMGSLLHSNSIPRCLLSSLHAGEITQLYLDIGHMDDIKIQSFSSNGLTRISSAALDVVTAMYKTLLLDALPSILDDTIKPIINANIRDYVGEGSNAICPSPPDVTNDPVIDLRDLLLRPVDAKALGGLGDSPYGDLFGTLKSFISETLLEPDEEGRLPVNDIIAALTERQSGAHGVLALQGDIFNEAVDVNLADIQGMMQLGIFDASIAHVDTLSPPVEILEPYGAHTLNNGVTLGNLPTQPLRVTFGMLIAVGGEKQMLRNEVMISFDLTALELFAAFLTRIDMRSLLRLPLRETLDPYCWLATIPPPDLSPYGMRANNDNEVNLALGEIRAAVGRLKLDIQCLSCTSPALEEWSVLLSSPEAIDDATTVTNSLLNYASELLDGRFVQLLLDRLLNTAASKCESSPRFGMVVPDFKAFEAKDFEDDSANFFIAFGVATIILVGIITFITYGVKFYVRRRHSRWIKTLSTEEIILLLEEQGYEVEQENITNRLSLSMASSKCIPLAIRISVPIIIVGNIALFASGHLSLGGTVMIAMEFGNQNLILDEFYNFSILGTVVEMWNAGARGMTILIALFSILWPYAKQITTLVLWFMPPTAVSSKRRGRIFSWLDALGKLSFMDIFILIIAMVAFRVSISSPEVNFFPEDFYSVDLVLVALWGLWSNMLAQILSQLTSHVIVYYQEKVVREARTRYEQSTSQHDGDVEEAGDPTTGAHTSSPDSESTSSSKNNCLAQRTGDNKDKDQRKCRLDKQSYGVGDHKPQRKLRVKSGVNLLVILTAILAAIFMIVGCALPAFHFELLGIVGIVVESGQKFDRAIAYYSIFSIVKNLFEQAAFLDLPGQYLGLGLLSIILIATVLIMPLLLIGLFLRLWFAPLTRHQMERTLFRIEIIKSWQYSEVFILSVIIAAWQVGGLSGYMVNEYCGPLEGIFSTLTQFNLIEVEDGQCFYVRSKVEAGTYMLVVGAFLLALLSWFVTKAATQKLHEDSVATRREAMSDCDHASLSSAAEKDCTKVKPVPVLFTDSFRWLLCTDKTNEMTMRVESTTSIYEAEGSSSHSSTNDIGVAR